MARGPILSSSPWFITCSIPAFDTPNSIPQLPLSVRVRLHFWNTVFLVFSVLDRLGWTATADLRSLCCLPVCFSWSPLYVILGRRGMWWCVEGTEWNGKGRRINPLTVHDAMCLICLSLTGDLWLRCGYCTLTQYVSSIVSFFIGLVFRELKSQITKEAHTSPHHTYSSRTRQ